MFHYKAFNLHLSVPFECPELIEIDKKENELDLISVYYTSSLPEKLDNFTNSGPTFTSNKNQFLLNTKADVKFLVINGNKIYIDLGEDCTIEQMKLLFFSSVMAALFMQKKMLVFHASTININDKAVLFCGDSGLGKSTISETLVKQGYKKLSDDMSVIYYNNEKQKIMCIPSYPQSKLWEESINLLNIDTNGLKHVHNRLNKYLVTNKESFYHKELPVEKIYILSINNKQNVLLNDIDKLKAIYEIENQTFRKKFYIKDEYRKNYFNLFVKIVEQATIKHLSRPYKTNSISEIKNILNNDLNG